MAANNRGGSGSDEEDAYDSSRKDEIREDLSRRLRKICSNFSPDDFAALVEEMTAKKIMGDRRTSL